MRKGGVSEKVWTYHGVVPHAGWVVECEGLGFVEDSLIDNFFVFWFPTHNGLLVEVIQTFTHGTI